MSPFQMVDMNNKVTLLNYDYSKWGIDNIKFKPRSVGYTTDILGTINTYGTTLDYNNFSEESILDILSTLSMNRTDNRDFIIQTTEYGYQQFQQALRERVLWIWQ